MDELFDAIYDVVFDQLKSFRKSDLVGMGIYNNKPSDHDELYPPFEYITDHIIRAMGIGELNSYKARGVKKDELNQLESLIGFLDAITIDKLSEKLLIITAFNLQYSKSKIDKFSAVLHQISSLIRDEELSEVLLPVLIARRNELAKQDLSHGKSIVVPKSVAVVCRVAWYHITGVPPPYNRATNFVFLYENGEVLGWRGSVSATKTY